MHKKKKTSKPYFMQKFSRMNIQLSHGVPASLARSFYNIIIHKIKKKTSEPYKYDSTLLANSGYLVRISARDACCCSTFNSFNCLALFFALRSLAFIFHFSVLARPPDGPG
jgi:hypothetical protein